VQDYLLGSFTESDDFNTVYHILIAFRCINKEKGKQVSLHPFHYGDGTGYTFSSYGCIGGFRNEYHNLRNELLGLEKSSGKKLFTSFIESENPHIASSSFSNTSFSEKVSMVGNQESRVQELEKSTKKLKKEVSSLKSQIQSLTDEISSLKDNYSINK
jgi:hypothetical protein